VSLVAKFNNTNSWLNAFSDRVVKLLKIEIGRNRNRNYKSGNVSAPIDSSGSLRESIQAQSKDYENGFGYPISGNEYGILIDEGGKATPSIDNIISWIRKKPVKLRNRTGTFATITNSRIRGLAHNIARAINERDIQPTNFIDDAIEKAMTQINAIQEPIYKDVELNVDEMLIRAGYTKEGDNYIIK
tara:strand:+ start:22 stop:582 length:561 start_codon:yes stop_codon:yes gene_type:complete